MSNTPPNEGISWEEVQTRLYDYRKVYRDLPGGVGTFGLIFAIEPLVKRFEAGERTPELHAAIMAIE